MSSYCSVLSPVHVLLNVMLTAATWWGMCNSQFLEPSSQ